MFYLYEENSVSKWGLLNIMNQIVWSDLSISQTITRYELKNYIEENFCSEKRVNELGLNHRSTEKLY